MCITHSAATNPASATVVPSRCTAPATTAAVTRIIPSQAGARKSPSQTRGRARRLRGRFTGWCDQAVASPVVMMNRESRRWFSRDGGGPASRSSSRCARSPSVRSWAVSFGGSSCVGGRRPARSSRDVRLGSFLYGTSSPEHVARQTVSALFTLSQSHRRRTVADRGSAIHDRADGDRAVDNGIAISTTNFSDRTGPDRTGPDRTGPDRTGPDSELSRFQEHFLAWARHQALGTRPDRTTLGQVMTSTSPTDLRGHPRVEVSVNRSVYGPSAAASAAVERSGRHPYCEAGLLNMRDP